MTDNIISINKDKEKRERVEIECPQCGGNVFVQACNNLYAVRSKDGEVIVDDLEAHGFPMCVSCNYVITDLERFLDS